mmetsp:Transcript_6031/g.15542  ORF Transcript_6031/g.15542 Transcript_6031/m.15542 type:complete len:274 (+) Transcript_6031:680-1501(+)
MRHKLWAREGHHDIGDGVGPRLPLVAGPGLRRLGQRGDGHAAPGDDLVLAKLRRVLVNNIHLEALLTKHLHHIPAQLVRRKRLADADSDFLQRKLPLHLLLHLLLALLLSFCGHLPCLLCRLVCLPLLGLGPLGCCLLLLRVALPVCPRRCQLISGGFAAVCWWREAFRGRRRQWLGPCFRLACCPLRPHVGRWTLSRGNSPESVRIEGWDVLQFIIGVQRDYTSDQPPSRRSSRNRSRSGRLADNVIPATRARPEVERQGGHWGYSSVRKPA